MEFTWMKSVLFGFVSGLADILPVSEQAHRLLMLKFLGLRGEPALMELFIHLGLFAALYYSCQTHIIKMIRAKNLARIPKKKRKRPLDTRSLMDLSLWITMLIPVIIALFFYEKAASLVNTQLWLAMFLLINGVILYIPQFLPSSNKDSRSLSRVEGLLMGLGGAASVIPGVSGIGAAVSIGSVCGVERGFCLNMALLMNMGITLGKIFYDVMDLVSGGLAGMSFGLLVRCLSACIASFLGTMAGIRIMRGMASEEGYSLFTYYCWCIGLFTFILNLVA